MTTTPTAVADARALLQNTHAARRYPEIAARLGTHERASAADVTVVVVGEKKRGKSSLVNALLRLPGLFPVDVDIATSCYLGAKAGPVVRATAYGDEAPQGRSIPVDEIAEWASVEGNRVPGSMPPEPIHPGVTAVVVELPNALLESGLTIVDTPGVGGLEAGHTDVTLAILRLADTLLFVVDPDSGLRSSELAFLAEATHRISQVAFAMTKVDRYPSWQDVLDENRARLSANAPEWVDSPWFAVSSLVAYDAAEAAEAGDQDEADELWSESGFDRLAAHLGEQVAGRSEAIRNANDAHQLRGVISALEDAERLALASATGDPELRDQLGEQQAALTALLADDAAWPGDLSRAFDEVRSSLQKDFRARLRTARADLQDRLAADALALSMLPSEIDAALRAVWIELMASLEHQVRGVVVLLAGDLANDGTDVLSGQFAYPEQLAALPELRAIAEGEKDFGDTVDEFMPVALATGGAYTILVGMLSLVNPLTAIALGLGAGMARRNAHADKRTRARDRASGMAYVSRTLEQAADDLGTDLQRVLTETRERCETSVRELMTVRRADLEDQVRGLKQQVRADEASAAVARKQNEQTMGELADLRARIAEAVDSEQDTP